jgi:hypothetical protein
MNEISSSALSRSTRLERLKTNIDTRGPLPTVDLRCSTMMCRSIMDGQCGVGRGGGCGCASLWVASPNPDPRPWRRSRTGWGAWLQLRASCIAGLGKLGRTTPPLRGLQAESLAFAVIPGERLGANP